MKLDKIKFAKLIAYLGPKCKFELDIDAINTLDHIIDIELPAAEEPIIVRPDNDVLERLMFLMAEGTRKIEAIKHHRAITGMGLKESKDTVERYWKSAEPVANSYISFKDINN